MLLFRVVRIRHEHEVNKEAVLLALCSKTFTSKVIIFSVTKQAAHRLKIFFGLAGLKAAELHDFRTVQEAEGIFNCTDVAARGLDIIDIQIVINYACPRDLISYVNRVGRAARAGKEGYAVTLVTDNDQPLLKAIVNIIFLTYSELFERRFRRVQLQKFK